MRVGRWRMREIDRALWKHPPREPAPPAKKGKLAKQMDREHAWNLLRSAMALLRGKVIDR